MQYGDIFVEVRQRIAAFRLYNEFYGRTGMYGDAEEGDYLDAAYRFLYGSASADFMEFCASREGMGLDEYLTGLGVNRRGLIGNEGEDKCDTSRSTGLF